MDLSLLNNKFFLSFLSFLGGIIATVITHRFLNKRALMTYFVNHLRVGMSTDDAVFGSVKVTWNANDVANLYLSTIELINESMIDFENVEVKAYTSNTTLLTERVEILGTIQLVEWTKSFAELVKVNPGEKPTQKQWDLHGGQRHYLIPIFNRQQIIRLSFLNAAKTQDTPSIFLDVLHKGVKLKFRVPQIQILGVEQPTAALVGAILGIIVVSTLLVFIHPLWVVAFCSLLYGFVAQMPGAFTVKFWRWVRNIFAG